MVKSILQSIVSVVTVWLGLLLGFQLSFCEDGKFWTFVFDLLYCGPFAENCLLWNSVIIHHKIAKLESLQPEIRDNFLRAKLSFFTLIILHI